MELLIEVMKGDRAKRKPLPVNQVGKGFEVSFTEAFLYSLPNVLSPPA
jgi:hypothetical protein